MKWLMLIVFVAMFCGCYRYNNVWEREVVTRIDRNCYHMCKVKHHQCMASRTMSDSSIHCDKLESWCIQTCAAPVEIVVPNYKKIELLKRCGPPTPGVSEEIYWQWCENGLL